MLLNELFEYQDLEAEKKKIIATVSGLSAENEQDAALLDRIYKILNSGSIGSNITNALMTPTADENLGEKELDKVRKDITQILAGLDSDYKNLNNFLGRLEKGGVVDVAELAKPMNTLDKVFGSDPVALKAFIALSRYGVGVKQKGPCEFALACLSNQIKLADGEGDLQVKGIGKVELKAALGPAGGRIGYGGGSQKAKTQVIQKYAEYVPTIANHINSKGGSIGLAPFVKALNNDLPISDPENRKIRKQLMTDLLTMDLEGYTPPVADVIANSDDVAKIEHTYMTQNFEWYKNRDDFDALSLISIPSMKTAMIKDANSLIQFRTSGQSNAPSISIIPTQAGAGREQWAQLTLNKK
jgi:hypothetical protein|tara:strand:+ start:55 stop:1122 length:1068 start_codon:yes stop_codon:yes gene_type:complete